MRRSKFAACWGMLLALTMTPLSSQELQVEPAQPTTADEVLVVSSLGCPILEELEAFEAGDHLWYVLLQPVIGEPRPCPGSPFPNAGASLGRLEVGLHSAILLGQIDEIDYPIELDVLTFEVREADSPTLELQEGRFHVSARWEVPAGTSGDSRAVPLTTDSGAFWFFRPDNLELIVKVLDGCAVNDRFWVLAAGLTDVGVELEITDTLTGSTWTHQNPTGSPFAAAQDTGAFDCP